MTLRSAVFPDLDRSDQRSLTESRRDWSGIPHLAKNERDAPNFLYAALDKPACAPFIEERRMKCAEPTKPHRKSGMWGTRNLWVGRFEKTFVRASPIFFGLCTVRRTWGTLPIPSGLCYDTDSVTLGAALELLGSMMIGGLL